MASCIQRSYYGDEKNVLKDFTRMFEHYNYYNFNFYDQEDVTALPRKICLDWRLFGWCGYSRGGGGQTVMSEFYTAQLTLMDRLQEP